MAVDLRGDMLARIATIRNTRLTRAAGEAHDAAEQAFADAERARAEREAATTARDAARASFTQAPGCVQTRLWLDRQIAGEAGAAAELADRHARLDVAREAHGAAVSALAHHQMRSDVISAYHRASALAEGRRAEDRAEADAPAARVSRLV